MKRVNPHLIRAYLCTFYIIKKKSAVREKKIKHSATFLCTCKVLCSLFFSVLSGGNNSQSGWISHQDKVGLLSVAVSHLRGILLSTISELTVQAAYWWKVKREDGFVKILIWRTRVSSLHPVRKPSIAKVFSLRRHLNESLLHACGTFKTCTTACFLLLHGGHFLVCRKCPPWDVWLFLWMIASFFITQNKT